MSYESPIEKRIEADLASNSKKELSLRLIETKLEFLIKLDRFSEAFELLLESISDFESIDSTKSKAQTICAILLEKLSETSCAKTLDLITKLPNWILDENYIQFAIGKSYFKLQPFE